MKILRVIVAVAVAISFFAQFASANYANGLLSSGETPSVRYSTPAYKVYAYPYGIYWSNAYISQDMNSIEFQGKHTICPNGQSCNTTSEYVAFQAAFNTMTVTQVNIMQSQTGGNRVPPPSSQSTVRYNPVATDDYVYLIGTGAVTDQDAFSLYVMNKDTPLVKYVFTLGRSTLVTAAGIATATGEVQIYVATPTQFMSFQCNSKCEHTRAAGPTFPQELRPLWAVSDSNTQTLFLIAANVSSNATLLIPVNTTSLALELDNSFDLTAAGVVPSGTANPNATLVVAFMSSHSVSSPPSSSELFIAWENRNTESGQPWPYTEFDANDIKERTSVISKIVISWTPSLTTYTVSGSQKIAYHGLINCFTESSVTNTAFLGTTGAAIVRVGLAQFGSSNNIGDAMTLACGDYNGEYNDGTAMKFSSIAVSGDGSTLIATGDWWGMVAKVNLAKYCPDGATWCKHYVQPNSSIKWVLLGVFGGIAGCVVCFAFFCGFAAFVIYRLKKASQYEKL